MHQTTASTAASPTSPGYRESPRARLDCPEDVAMLLQLQEEEEAAAATRCQQCLGMHSAKLAVVVQSTFRRENKRPKTCHSSSTWSSTPATTVVHFHRMLCARNGGGGGGAGGGDRTDSGATCARSMCKRFFFSVGCD